MSWKKIRAKNRRAGLEGHISLGEEGLVQRKTGMGRKEECGGIG